MAETGLLSMADRPTDFFGCDLADRVTDFAGCDLADRVTDCVGGDLADRLRILLVVIWPIDYGLCWL